MNPTERQAYILEHVMQEEFASIEELASYFQLSEQTLRKDVNELCKEGLLRRCYGGVELPSKRINTSYEARKILHLNEKKTIASMVAEQIHDGASLFISIGTTPEVVARALLKHQNLKIFTNNLHVALVCSENPSFEVTLFGGKVRNQYGDILGHEIESFFSAYHVDYGLFGVGAIGNDGTLLDFTEEEMRAREAIARSSEKVFLVADSSKFSRKAYVKGGNITQVGAFFCDQEPPEHLSLLAQKNGVELYFPVPQRLAI
jgi:DeoR family glycerol-3-phosphate regulon repressor